MTNRPGAGASNPAMPPSTRLLPLAALGVALGAAILLALALAPPTVGANGVGELAPDDAAAAEAPRPGPSAPPHGEAPSEFPAPPPEDPVDCAPSLARRVQQRYEGIRDLWARFRQRSFSVALGDQGATLEARGEVVFAKPGRMRWTYASPEPSVVVSDGETLWIYDPTAKEVQVMDVGQGFLSGTAIQFLLGEGDLLEAFEVEARGCGGETVRLVLRPRAEATYERLILEVDPATGLVRATSVHDLFGNRTDVVFDEIRTDTEPPPERFRFQPPEGTRVLELR
jgi:outer membrane lipoprotein carrier protein